MDIELKPRRTKMTFTIQHLKKERFSFLMKTLNSNTSEKTIIEFCNLACELEGMTSSEAYAKMIYYKKENSRAKLLAREAKKTKSI
jgi:hypothetical protein